MKNRIQKTKFFHALLPMLGGALLLSACPSGEMKVGEYASGESPAVNGDNLGGQSGESPDASGDNSGGQHAAVVSTIADGGVVANCPTVPTVCKGEGNFCDGNAQVTCGIDANGCLVATQRSDCAAPEDGLAACKGGTCGITCGGQTYACARGKCPLECPKLEDLGAPAGYCAAGTNADGRVVVISDANGTDANGTGLPFKWSKNGSLESLPLPNPAPTGTSRAKYTTAAFKVSADGSRIVGYTTNFDGSGGGGRTCLAWTGTTPESAIPDSYCWGISDDGTMVVGETTRLPISGVMRKSWVVSQLFPGRAYGVSGDGRVVLGEVNGVGPARWTEAGGVAKLEGLDDRYKGLSDTSWAPFDASWNGSVIVGGTRKMLASNGTDTEKLGFRWTRDNVLMLNFSATSVSGDGSVVTGVAGTFLHAEQQRARIWTPDLGEKGLLEHLADNNVPTDSWDNLRLALDVSGDGRVVVGCGTRNGVQKAYRAVLPPKR